MHISENARRVLEARYLRRGSDGALLEDPAQLVERVARAVAEGERSYGGAAAVADRAAEFQALLASFDFLPNSPTLMNAGTGCGQLSACFVLPVEDSMPQIFDALKLMALVQQSGGGTGFAFSHLRPTGDPVSTGDGAASGPVGFMRIFDCATEQIRQGGRRRGANMGVLRVDHPDIAAFIAAKQDGVSLSNFNLSVAVTDDFMQAAATGEPFHLRHPRSGAPVGAVDARVLLQAIADAAWRTGDPGMLFIDAINRANPTPASGAIEATNPCGEVPLLANEACNLGSINLSHMLRQDGDTTTIDRDRLAATAQLAVRFLDDVIEVNRLPTPAITAAVNDNRKLGLGVMGFAEMLIRLGVPYAAEQAAAVAEQVMQCIATAAGDASERLARERGVFPNWPRSTWAERGLERRHATLTSIAPTGSLSILAGTSAGIEPLFALAYRRRALDGQVLEELNPLFQDHLRATGKDTPEVRAALRAGGDQATAMLDRVLGPADRELFRTALEIAPTAHLRIQAAFQRHVDNAVSKTVNLPTDCTPADVLAIYRQAWELGLKGVTVYRYGSKAEQVLTLGTGETAQQHEHYAHCDPHDCRV